jgi:3-hydroxybutyryl-CoA dehydrogenase
LSVSTIAVIAASGVGCAFADRALRGGHKVVLEDVSAPRLEQATASIRLSIQQALASDSHRQREPKDPAANANAVLANLSFTGDVQEAIRDADLIIETLPEEMEMHIELFTILDKFAKPNAILACGTVALPITEMAEVTFCPDRCIGMRLRNPEDVLELVRGTATSDQTVEICREFGRQIGANVAVLQEYDSTSSATAGAGR